LDLLIPWLKSRNLFINYSKSKFIHFKRPNQNDRDSFVSILYDLNIISSCLSYEYLRLIIDEKLSWIPHIEKVSKRISPIISILKKIPYIVNLKIIYNSFINSHLSYLLPIWGSAFVTHITQLRTLQDRALKFMGFHPFESQNQLAHSQQYHFESILLIYKMIHKLSRCNFPLITNSVTGRNTRSSSLLRQPNYLSSVAQKSIFYNGLHEFNCLPNNLKSLNSVSKFQLKLKKYIFETRPIV
jgi:hypothetical protein